MLSERWNDPESAGEFYRSFAATGRHLVDFSTSYSMRDRHPGTAARAASINAHMRIVYLVRDPIARAVSHYNHLVARNRATGSLEDMCRDHRSEVLLHGKYAYQLEPWLDRFPERQILVVPFEEYTSARAELVEKIARHLDLAVAPASELSAVHHQTSRTPIITGAPRRVHDSRVYQELVRPRLPANARRLGTRLLGRVPQVQSTASAALKAELAGIFSDDVRSLHRLTGVGHAWLESWQEAPE